MRVLVLDENCLIAGFGFHILIKLFMFFYPSGVVIRAGVDKTSGI
jgi:hypothetical protein